MYRTERESPLLFLHNLTKFSEKSWSKATRFLNCRASSGGRHSSFHFRAWTVATAIKKTILHLAILNSIHFDEKLCMLNIPEDSNRFFFAQYWRRMKQRKMAFEKVVSSQVKAEKYKEDGWGLSFYHWSRWKTCNCNWKKSIYQNLSWTNWNIFRNKCNIIFIKQTR